MKQSWKVSMSGLFVLLYIGTVAGEVEATSGWEIAGYVFAGLFGLSALITLISYGCQMCNKSETVIQPTDQSGTNTETTARLPLPGHGSTNPPPSVVRLQPPGYTFQT